MGRPQIGSRLARFHALKFAVRHLPLIARRAPFFGDVRRIVDEGEIVEEFAEEQDVILTSAETELSRRLPSPPSAHVSRRIALVRLENVTVLGNTGRIVDEGRGLLLRSRLEPPQVEVNDFRAEMTRLVRQPDDNCVYLMGEHNGHAHFFHFLFDRLPRLFYLFERFSAGPDPITVLVNEEPPAFQRDIFRFVTERYGNVEFRQIPRRERWLLPRLLCVDDWNSTTRATFLAPATLEFMRLLVFGGYRLDPAPPYREIYVSRSDAKKRRLKNEAELWPLFAAKGFERVAAATLPFCNQVALFAEAKAIAGLHGAGLSHVLFAPRGARVLEIFPADKAFDIDYFYLTKAMAGAYDAVIGSQGGRLGAFYAETAAIERALERF